MKKQASFNGEAQLLGDVQHTLSRKLSCSLIEQPQLSPVQEEHLSNLCLVSHSLFYWEVIVITEVSNGATYMIAN
jgi:hypothetical protein